MATLSYSYAESVVWVLDLTAEAHPMVHDMCGHHADTLRVPRGWECRDGRLARVSVGASTMQSYDDPSRSTTQRRLSA